MPYSDYPNGGIVRQFLIDAGLPAGNLSAAWYDSAAAVAARDFEGASGANRKMLAGASETRLYSAPAGNAGTLDIDDLAVVTAVSYQPSNTTPVVWTAGVDYWLEPSDAPGKGWPYTAIRFLRRWLDTASGPGVGWPADRRSIAVTGQFGYSLTLPDDVWQAVLERAAAKVARQLGFAITGGGISKWERAERSVSYRSSADIAAAFSADWATTAAAYRRVRF